MIDHELNDIETVRMKNKLGRRKSKDIIDTCSILKEEKLACTSTVANIDLTPS